MDARLAECKGNEIEAFSRLSGDEMDAINYELAHVIGNTEAHTRYFLENYFIINTKGEDWEPQRLQTVYPFSETQEILWAEFKAAWDAGMPAWFLLLKARQIRWSTLVLASIFHRTITNSLTNSLVIADELKRSNQIFNMAHLAYNRLPWWMRPECSLDNRGEGVMAFNRKNKDEQLSNPGLESSFFVDAANKPSGSSRGFTLHNLHATEFGLWTKSSTLTSDIVPAIPGKNPNVIAVVEGTAKGAGEGNAFSRMWKAAISGKGRFKPVFAGWWKEKTYCKPFPSTMDEELFEFTREEKELAAKVLDEYTYAITKPQMAWRREQYEQFEATEGDGEKVEQEYPSTAEAAFRADGLSAFSHKVLAAIEVRDVRRPKWFGELVHQKDGQREKPVLVPYPEEEMMQAPLWIWEWPDSHSLYYGASDPASGGGSSNAGRVPIGGIMGLDYSSCQIFRVPRRQGERIRQCVEYRGYADAKELAKIICSLGHMYNTCEISPEMNTMTEHIGNILNIHLYPKIYRWRRQDRVHNRMTWCFGWETNHKSREDLIQRFRSFMVDNSIEMRSSRLVSECRNFVDDGSGRFEAISGEHDDALFAAMICVYCLLELDPKLFRNIDPDQIPEPGKGKHNTDHSIFDEVTAGGVPDYNML